MHALTRVRRPLLLAAALGLGVMLATAVAAVAATNITVSPRDNCGGFNGHAVWSGNNGHYMELYGEVWENKCSGTSSVWLAWDSPSYHNVNVKAATEEDTEGVNYKVSTSTTPTNIKVTVCSTLGGWHCGTPVSVPPGGFAPGTSTTPTSSPPPPVVTTPVPSPVPEPAPRPKALRVKLKLSWTWDRAVTRLSKAAIGRFPGKTRLRVRCTPGTPVRVRRGPPPPARARSAGCCAAWRAAATGPATSC